MEHGDTDTGDVFRAIADPGRRALMDALFAEDGQSLNELCDVLPGMTRFGVMKHLRILAEANLVLTEKVGRSKLHYLNPVPIQQIHDRWIAKYARPTTQTLTELSDRLSEPDSS
jgi:DNA-binding transcriptional ArsR family regulator